jgi:hypothetical protein
VTKPSIRVEGLLQLQKSLKAIDAQAPKGLRLANNEAANLLVTRTRPLIPRRTGRAAKALKASSTRTAARVTMGSSRARYLPFLDFGGRVGPRNSVRRPFIPQGRYLFPTLVRIGPEVTDVLEKALDRVARDAGLEVS